MEFADHNDYERTFERDVFQHMNEDWEYDPPADCIVDKEINKLNEITRTSDLVPAYKCFFIEINDDRWDERSQRSFLRSFLLHRLLRKEDMRTLGNMMLPVAFKNLDLVSDLVFRDVGFYRFLHSDLQKHPSVAMSFLHCTSYGYSMADDVEISAKSFPWQLLTFEMFFKQYLMIPHVSPPPWLCSVIEDKFGTFLYNEMDELHWVARKFIELVRLIATDGRSSSTIGRLYSLVAPITYAVEKAAAADINKLNELQERGYINKLNELLFWMLYEFARKCPKKQLVSIIIRDETFVFPNKYMVPLLCMIVKERPVHLGDCLHACDDSETMGLVMSAFLNPETCTLPEYLIGGQNPIFESSSVDLRPDIVSVLRALEPADDAADLQDPMRARNWFDAWASSAIKDDVIKFWRRFSGTTPFNSSADAASDIMSLIPLAWREDPVCAREFVKTDARAVRAIVNQFITDGNSITNREALDRLSYSEYDTTGGAVSALQSRYESIEKSAIPSFTVFMKACFDGSSIDLTGKSDQFNMRFLLGDDAFAFAMAAYCDSPGEAKKIVRAHRLNFSLTKGTVLALMPATLRASIIEDREFLEEFISRNPFEIGRLPVNLQFDDKLLELAITRDPLSARWICDTTRLLAKPAIREMLLIKDSTVMWTFSSLPTSEQGASLACSIISDERLSVHRRKKFYTDTLPTVVKHDRKCKLLVARFFGPDLLMSQSDDMDLGDRLATNLLRIVHDSHAASGDSTRSSNSAYLRSLYVDLQEAFMPLAIAEAAKLPATNQGKTYKSTVGDWMPAWDGFTLRSTAAHPSRETHSHLCRLHGFLDEVSNMVGMILEPRRRDGISYPAKRYCEKFEGVLVEYKFLTTYNSDTMTHTLDTTPTLVTKSSHKPVQIPESWKSQMEDAFQRGQMPLFWGILHAGYGQRTKATKLKNGTLTSDADWEGVVIKVYQTTAVDGPPTEHKCFFEKELCDSLSFVECVEHFEFHNYGISNEEEREILDFHRESRRKGGAGIVFRDVDTPTKFVAMDAAGYTLYAQKIIDFLHQYPLHVLSLYMHEAEMLGCDDREGEEHEEGNDAVVYPNIDEVIDYVVKQITPRLEGKRRAASSSRPKSGAKKQRITLQGAASSSTSHGAPSAPPAPPASLYWEGEEEDDDDEDVSEVSDGEVSEVSDEE